VGKLNMENNEKNITTVEYINKIFSAVGRLKEKHEQFFDNDALIAYRGESTDYGETKLMPSLFRNSSYLAKENHLFELLCDYNMIHDSASNIEKAIESQHYLSISRMLDISFNALSALYFACESNKTNKSNEGEDGYVFVFAFPEKHSPHSKYIKDFYTSILKEEETTYFKNFKVFSHSYSNERIKAQKGGFIFFSGTGFFSIDECYYEKIDIKLIHKKIILEELDVLFQINKLAIYPEKDKIAEVVKAKFKENSYHYKKSGIEDEVKTYFDRLEYELALSKKTNKEKLRLLRKEEHDFLVHIERNKRHEDYHEDYQKIQEKGMRKFSIFREIYNEILV